MAPGLLSWLMMGLVLLGASAAAQAQRGTASPSRLIVHEWAVIHSLAGGDGSSAPWQPWDFPPSLPSFVGTFDLPADIAPCGVMLDVPAVFFRVDKPVSLTMRYHWLEGNFVSCYPHGAREEHALHWRDVTVIPHGGPLLTEAADTNYYHPRRTSASFVRVDNLGHKQFERFISLRGMGNLALPVRVTLTAQGLKLAWAKETDLRHVLVIDQPWGDEHDAGQARMTLHDLGKDRAAASAGGSQMGLTLPRPAATMSADVAMAPLRKLLNRQGLYPDEAAAVLASARAQWFSPGLRVIYLLPESQVSSAVQLEISPAPTEHRRLYAVCVEVLTPEAIRAIHAKLVALPAKDDQAHAALLASSPMVRLALQRMLQDQSAARQLVVDQSQHDMIARLLGVADATTPAVSP